MLDYLLVQHRNVDTGVNMFHLFEVEELRGDSFWKIDRLRLATYQSIREQQIIEQ